MADWFYGENGQHSGPVPDEEIHAMVASGRLGPASLLWREGLAGWTTLGYLQQTGALGGTISPYMPPGAPGYPPYAHFGPQVSGLAITSLVCGVIGLLTCMLIPGIPAVICGHMALNRIAAAPFQLTGRALAIWGLLCGYLCILVMAAFVAAMIFAMVYGH